ncbi:MFS transporter [Kineosporia succinea]|uniref:MFS family permease n=1 Tax=Kineosporia succinea TaxID=84632 RepID=A0ABT9NX34_9ACTN|nr:hypothetical protein [Kineosporia succinea]MDP9824991.1 MFS family permease [Kineosporia succinea]
MDSASSRGGLLLAMILVTVGMTGLLTARSSEPPSSARRPGPKSRSPLVIKPFVVLVAVNVTMGFFFGGIGLVISAFALAHRNPALAGVVMTAAGLVITVGTALLSGVPNLGLMLVGYAIVGGCVALVLIPAAVLLHETTSSTIITQAMTWMNSASALGIAISAPLIGHVVQAQGWVRGFLALAALTACLPATLPIARVKTNPVPTA